MFHWFEETIDAGTAIVDAEEFPFKIDAGIIVQWLVILPAGCAGLVGFQVHHKNISLLPRNRDAWFRGDNVALLIHENLEIGGDLPELTVHAYNTDSDNDHAVIIGINVLPKRESEQLRLIKAQLQNISEVLGGF